MSLLDKKAEEVERAFVSSLVFLLLQIIFSDSRIFFLFSFIFFRVICEGICSSGSFFFLAPSHFLFRDGTRVSRLFFFKHIFAYMRLTNRRRFFNS